MNGKCVFVLGAGASVEAGAPLMATFLDRARNLLTAGNLFGGDPHAFQLVFRAISELQAAHSKSDLDLHNLEPVFSAFEMLSLLKRKLPGLDELEVRQLPDAMRTLIIRTLEESIEFTQTSFTSTNDVGLESPGGYSALAKLIRSNPRRFSIITFNYDLLMDIALLAESMRIDYGMLPLREDGKVPLLKLHGSMNWMKCSCEEIHAIPLVPLLQNNQFPQIRKLGSKDHRLKICISQASDLPPQCNKPLEKGLAFIVPPTWNKGVSYPAINKVWAAAASELANAEIIVVIGYSMPESDQFFRYLYALGTIGPAIIRKFILCDPDKDKVVEPRFRSQLGRAVLARFKAITGERATFNNVVHSFDGELDIDRMAKGL